MNGIDLLIDESKFPSHYQKMKSNENGFSWGYGDRDVFNYSFHALNNAQSRGPRIDIYLTLSTHEPFEVPEDRFRNEFDERLNTVSIDEAKKKSYKNNRKIFECLSYTDNSLQEFFNKYKKRADFNNTIFIITGDHRLVPMKQDTRIDRFHVPLIIYSSLVKTSKKFSSLNVHASVTPTLLGWFTESYKKEFPKKMPFIAGPLSFKTDFSSNLDVALIRSKNETIDYINGTDFLSGNQLYKIQPNLDLEPWNNSDVKKSLIKKLSEFKSKASFAMRNDRLDKPNHPTLLDVFSLSEDENQFIRSQNLATHSPDQLFEDARNLAKRKHYNESRTVLKYLLNASPNYHDARIFIARTFGWEGQYDSARNYLQQTKLRVPNSGELYAAWADIEYWSGNPEVSLELACEGLKHDSINNELLGRKARILLIKGNRGDAETITQKILKSDPSNEIANGILKKLNRI
jgi:hypothetical protein